MTFFVQLNVNINRLMHFVRLGSYFNYILYIIGEFVSGS